MISLIKALFFGAFLSWIVSLFISSAGSTGGLLYVHKVALFGAHFAWSLPIFVAGTVLAWALLWMMK